LGDFSRNGQPLDFSTRPAPGDLKRLSGPVIVIQPLSCGISDGTMDDESLKLFSDISP
jgi:hypothetical protein